MTGTRPRLLWALVLLAWAAVSVPLLLGQRSLTFRDVADHRAWKAFGAEALQTGRVPAFNPTWGLGQPFRGNPNTVALYPGNLLYLVLPFEVAFNGHFALHWLIGLLGMASLARTLGQTEAASCLAGVVYAGSGWTWSCLSFYHLIVITAWTPWALAGMARGDRRGRALGALAFGLALYGGAPVVAAVAGLALLLVLLSSARRRGESPVRAVAISLAVAVTGLLLYTPQLVATGRIMGYTTRWTDWLVAHDPTAFSLHPLRLLELLVPFPFGIPTALGPAELWTSDAVPRVPYVLSLYSGTVAVWLALVAGRRRPFWSALAAGSLAVAWLGGPLLGPLTGHLVRHSEKLLFGFALALPLLAGWGLDRVGGQPTAGRAPRIAGLLVGAAGLLLLVARGPLLTSMEGALAARGLGDPSSQSAGLAAAAAHFDLWIVGLILGGGSLLAACLLASRHPRWVVALQLACALLLAPLAPTVDSDLLRLPSPWRHAISSGDHVIRALDTEPPWEEQPPVRLPSRAAAVRLASLSLAPLTGVRQGLSYPVVSDPDGFMAPGYKTVASGLALLSWPERIAWSRRLGVSSIALFQPPPMPELQIRARLDELGVNGWLVTIDDPGPAIWWPEEIATVGSPREALARLGSVERPAALSVLLGSAGSSTQPPGRATLRDAGPDRLVVVTDAPAGGLVVVQRAFHPLLRAEADGAPVATLAVDCGLLGLRAPPGRHTITVSTSAWPELLGGLVALVTAATLGLAASRRRPPGQPA